MLINSISIYKTPLQSDYSNVYDEFNSNYNLYEFFNLNFIHKRIYVVNKSLNLNKKITIQLKLTEEEIQNINEYNYCIIETPETETSDYQYYFYFIDSYHINNTIGTEVNFSLTWDAWNNNYVKLKDLNNNEYIEMRHIDDYTVNNNIATGRNYLSDEESFGTEETFDDSGYSVLYLRLWIDNEGLLTDSNSTPNQRYGCIPSLLPIQVVYKPIALINRATREIVTNCVQYTVFINGVPYNYDLELTRFGKITTVYNSHVLTSDLTMLFNIGFTYGGTASTFTYDNNVADIFGNAFINEEKLIEKCFVSYPTLDSVFASKTISYKIDISTLSENSTDFNDKYIMEARAHYYPYEYKSIRIGEKKIDLLGEYDTKQVHLRYNYMNTLVPKLRYRYDNNLDNSKYVYYSNFGNNVVINDSLSEYLRGNSNQINATRINSIIGTSISSISNSLSGNVLGTVKGVSGIIQNEISIEAKRADEDSKQDTLSVPSSFANADFVFQDDYCYVRNYVSDDKNIKKLVNKLTLYGINYKNYGNIFENFRKNFDFIKTDNCELKSANISNEDKKILKNAFNNGVRKWHINGYDWSVIYFNTDYLNIPKSFN